MSAPVKTEAFVYENGDTLFIAFKAYDPDPSKIIANLTDRDSNWNDDRVAVKIDSYHDHSLAYQFFINPLGTQADAIENELTKNESPAWDGIWEAAGQITDFGYQVEIAIPLRILNFDDSLDIQHWGMEFVRFYPRDTQMRISNAQMSQDNNCWICQMPIERGFSGAKQGNNLTAIPTFVTGKTKSRDLSETNDWSEESNSDVGLDVKWGITPDITLNATLNPDFSQVEADSGQLNVNNTFALYLQEKRSFFLENQDYFDTPVNLIYTRNINAPDYGAKITGKSGDHSFAAFIANDKTANIITPSNLRSSGYSIEQDTLNSAFRYRYAVNKELAVGVVSTIRDNDDYHNEVLSFDTKYQPSPQDTVNFQIIRTNTEFSEVGLSDVFDYFSDTSTDEHTNITTFNFGEQYLRAFSVNSSDLAYRIQYTHENRDWYFNVRHEDIGENFRADLAFIDTVDRTMSVIGGGYVWRGDDDDWWSRFRINGDIDITHNQDGELLEQENEFNINFNGPKQSYLRVGFLGRDRVGARTNNELVYSHDNPVIIDAQSAQDYLAIDANTDMFYEKNINMWGEFKPTSNLWLGNYFKKGKAIDYANNRISDQLVLEPNISWNINTHLKSQIRFEYTRLDHEGDNVFTAKLLDLRNTYQFSIKSFLRLSLVYTEIDRNLSKYVDPGDRNENFRRLSAQLLYSYKINPQTLFFVGYSEAGKDNDSLTNIKSDNRSVFMKLSYAWLL
ncbi:carbohydrate binding family 9 domain-containing protein [Psychrosphaera algicola]|uniref:DUF5916 domain-containing protein n=1 Tax=Psychrosphaera algicola TaxID=3023714 RepID=A0ABT5F9E2_9GAMM|nr:DUF5916 domain-containing protein [Psychrosphaera sp. G1-22]MDC2888011.1 DUF5916 domain-containing protein [Psychrosphaera sp. G1-22]